MKVAEKTNGSVQSTTERREEAILIPSVNGKSKNEILEVNGKEQEKSEVKKEEAKNVTETERPKEFFKPVLNLEATLKVVDDLHRRSIQRINLLSRINQLEDFGNHLDRGGRRIRNQSFSRLPINY